MLFISTGSVDMNIRFLPLLLLCGSRAAPARVRDISFSLQESTHKPDEPNISRMRTKARTTNTLISTAFAEFSTEAAIIAPCSVNT